jgi:hypothetical protein
MIEKFLMRESAITQGYRGRADTLLDGSRYLHRIDRSAVRDVVRG